MGGIQYVGTGRLGATQSVAYTGTAGTITNAISSQIYKVRILVSTDAFIVADGTTPSSTNGTYLPALEPEYITVSPGEKISAVQVSAGGTLYVTEIS